MLIPLMAKYNKNMGNKRVDPWGDARRKCGELNAIQYTVYGNYLDILIQPK